MDLMYIHGSNKRKISIFKTLKIILVWSIKYAVCVARVRWFLLVNSSKDISLAYNTHQVTSIRKTLAEIDALGELQQDGALVVYVTFLTKYCVKAVKFALSVWEA